MRGKLQENVIEYAQTASEIRLMLLSFLNKHSNDIMIG